MIMLSFFSIVLKSLQFPEALILNGLKECWLILMKKLLTLLDSCANAWQE